MMNESSNYCVRCGIWPNDMVEHMKIEHSDPDKDQGLIDGLGNQITAIVEEFKEEIAKIPTDPKIYIRLVDYHYSSTIIQMITLDVEKAFNFVPDEVHAIETEIHVWQAGEKIETWEWRVNSHSFVKTDW